MSMGFRGKQLVLGLLAVLGAYVGVFAEFFPHRFYASFPVPGHHWVAGLGPYNEHLIRDVGSMYLALTVASVWAALRPRRESFALVGSAWLVFGVFHLAFHLFHLGMYSASDKIGNVVALGGSVVLAALLLLPPRRQRPPRAPLSPAADGIEPGQQAEG